MLYEEGSYDQEELNKMPEPGQRKDSFWMGLEIVIERGRKRARIQIKRT